MGLLVQVLAGLTPGARALTGHKVMDVRKASVGAANFQGHLQAVPFAARAQLMGLRSHWLKEFRPLVRKHDLYARVG